MVTFGIPVEGPRLVAFGAPRKPGDKLANGRAGFRVTQRFYDRDYYWNDGRLHGAIDCGNYDCGDRVIAAAMGRVYFVGYDPWGARGVKIDHGDGWTSESWHLGSWAVGEGQIVTRGQTIGRVGGTGLARGICHLHFVIRRNGIAVDPWPLVQNAPGLPDTSLPATKGRAHILTPPRGQVCNVRKSASLLGVLYASARSDGYTYRASDGKRLWKNGSQYLFFGWTTDGKWARLRTGGGLSLFASRSLVKVDRAP